MSHCFHVFIKHYLSSIIFSSEIHVNILFRKVCTAIDRCRSNGNLIFRSKQNGISSKLLSWCSWWKESNNKLFWRNRGLKYTDNIPCPWVKPSVARGILSIALKCIKWKGSISWNLRSVKYLCWHYLQVSLDPEWQCVSGSNRVV